MGSLLLARCGEFGQLTALMGIQRQVAGAGNGVLTADDVWPCADAQAKRLQLIIVKVCV
jgi:hypothetical protein